MRCLPAVLLLLSAAVLLSESVHALPLSFSRRRAQTQPYSIACEQIAVWLVVPVERTLVDTWLKSAPQGVAYGTHPFTSLPATQWPIFMEFNNPFGCYETILPFIKTEFHEYKLQVPFLQYPGVSTHVMYKPLIVVDNLINDISSKLVYGLNVVTKTPMNFDNQSSYTIVSPPQLSVSFQSAGDWVDGSSSPLFAPFVAMGNFTQWLGHDLFGRIRCAQNFYTSPVVRPLSGTLHINAGFLSKEQPAIDYAFGANGLGAVQLNTHMFITGLHKCTATN